MCKKRDGKNNKYGQYVVLRSIGGKPAYRVIWLNTNEQVGLFKTKEEAEEAAEQWNEQKQKTGKRPV